MNTLFLRGPTNPRASLSASRSTSGKPSDMSTATHVATETRSIQVIKTQVHKDLRRSVLAQNDADPCGPGPVDPQSGHEDISLPLGSLSLKHSAAMGGSKPRPRMRNQ